MLKSNDQKVIKQAEAKRDGVINPHHYNFKKKFDLQSDSQRHKNFVRFFNLPVQASTRGHPFYTVNPLFINSLWRALSKPPQRRQGPDPRPLWLLVVTPSAFGPELAYRLRVAQPTLMDVPIFLYTFILLYMFLYHILWPLRFCWLLVLSLYKEDYLQIFKCVSFWLHGCCG